MIPCVASRVGMEVEEGYTRKYGELPSSRTPHGGAVVKMMNMTDDDSIGVMSHPARGRELKSRTLPIQVDLPSSHLSWGAGIEMSERPTLQLTRCRIPHGVRELKLPANESALWWVQPCPAWGT